MTTMNLHQARHHRGRATAAVLLTWALPLVVTASPSHSVAAAPSQAAPAETDVDPAAPRIKVNALSRLQDSTDAVTDEVLARARQVFANEGFVIDDEANVLVQIIVTRSNVEGADYQVYFGFAMSPGGRIQSGYSYVCPRCSAGDLLDGVEKGAIATAKRLRDHGNEPGESTEGAAQPPAEAEAAPEVATPEPSADEEPVPLRKQPGFGLLASGMTLTIVGGAALAGTGAAVAVDAADGNGIDPRGLIAVGISGAMTLVGVPLLVVGAKRMRAPSRSSRVGFVPGRHGSMFVLSGRF